MIPAPDTPTSVRSSPAGWRALVTDAARCLRFYSRLPTPPLPWEGDPHAPPDFAVTPRALPLAGAVIGATGAVALGLAHLLGFGPALSAALAVAAIVIATGAFHEDGLADTADGFWGGHDRERRLEIMRDSRIGSYGAAALGLSLLLRIVAFATIMERSGALGAAMVLMVFTALSRTAALDVMMTLEPARTSGASHAVGRPLSRTVAIAWALCVALGLVLGLIGGLPLAGLALAFGAAALAGRGMTALARAKLGGSTGDVIGAAQQVAEVAALLALLACVPR